MSSQKSELCSHLKTCFHTRRCQINLNLTQFPCVFWREPSRRQNLGRLSHSQSTSWGAYEHCFGVSSMSLHQNMQSNRNHTQSHGCCRAPPFWCPRGGRQRGSLNPLTAASVGQVLKALGSLSCGICQHGSSSHFQI